MTERRWVLFDLGGVLVDFSGLRDLPELLPSPVDANLRLRLERTVRTVAHSTLRSGRYGADSSPPIVGPSQ